MDIAQHLVMMFFADLWELRLFEGGMGTVICVIIDLLPIIQ